MCAVTAVVVAVVVVVYILLCYAMLFHVKHYNSINSNPWSNVFLLLVAIKTGDYNFNCQMVCDSVCGVCVSVCCSISPVWKKVR
jgi:hypothetical protein